MKPNWSAFRAFVFLWFNRVRSLFRRDQLDREMTKEMRTHIDEQVQHNVKIGMSPDEASAAAHRQFGSITQIQERARDVKSWIGLESLVRDVRYALRSLSRARVFSLTVVVTLGLCIAANSTIFTALHGLILEPLPYRDSGQLVEIYNTQPLSGQLKRPVSVAQYLDYKENASLFEGFALWHVWPFVLGAEEGDPQRTEGAAVTGDLFQVLDVQPLLGRFFTPEDSGPNFAHIVVLTQTFWETKFNGDPDIVDKEILVNGRPFTIVGVAPRSVEVLNRNPIMFRPQDWPRNATDPITRFALRIEMYARVKSGVPLATARAQLDTIEKRFYQEVATPEIRDFVDEKGHQIALGQIMVEQTRSVRKGLYLLQGGALFVLLLGCVNVANLMLARTNARQGELAVRQSLGAGRLSIARQLLTESTLLAGIGSGIGLGATWASLQVINSFIRPILWERPPLEFTWSIARWTLLITVLVALLVALLPIVRVWRARLLRALKSGSRGTSTDGAMRTASGLLVTSQIALALTLLIGAGLLVRSFAHVASLDPGFDVRGLVHARVQVNASYTTRESLVRLRDEYPRMLREVPGFTSVCVAIRLPVTTRHDIGTFPIRGSSGSEELYPSARMIGVSPEFFDTMGIPIVEGRAFTAADARPGARPVFIVGRDFVEKHFPDQSAVGQGFGTGNSAEAIQYRPMIVGVAQTVPFSPPEDRDQLPVVYYPMPASGGYSFIVRSNRSREETVSLMRAKLREFDPALPLYAVTTVQETINQMLANRRGVMLLLGAFALIALVLAAVGIYGLLAYDVSQRTREIGIRGAMGATRGQIVTLILQQGLTKAGVGLAAGLGAALLLTRLMQSLLFNVEPVDLAAYGVVSLLLLAVVSVASLLPALRAAKVDPVIALRAE